MKNKEQYLTPINDIRNISDHWKFMLEGMIDEFEEFEVDSEENNPILKQNLEILKHTVSAVFLHSDQMYSDIHNDRMEWKNEN